MVTILPRDGESDNTAARRATESQQPPEEAADAEGHDAATAGRQHPAEETAVPESHDANAAGSGRPSSEAAEPERFFRGAGVDFGTKAEQYDRSRPTYPEAMVEAIIDASPGRTVLDVGVGTGIAARLFTARGCTVLGVDVDDRMAEVARHHGIDVEVARF